MLDIHNPTLGTPSDQTALSDLRQFVDLNAGALYDAATLLAGARGVLIVDRIIESLADRDGLPRRTLKALRDLSDILTLEHVDDPTRPEAHFFSAIDPAEPVVEEICLLTDQLVSFMSDIEASWAQQSSNARAAA